MAKLPPLLALLRCLLLPLLPLLLPLLAAGPAAAQMAVYSGGPLPVGHSRQLSAYVPLVVNTVRWSVNGVVGGNSTYGTVSSAGLYTAPAKVPSANQVRVTATSTSQPDQSASVTIAITQLPPRLWGSSPAQVPAGQAFVLTLNGANFTADAVAYLNGLALPTSLVSATQMRASGTVAASLLGRQLGLVVRQAGLGGVDSDLAQVTVVAATPTTPTTPPTTTPPPPTTVPATGAIPGSGLGTTTLKAARLLEQATFGPTPAAITRVNQLGAAAWLDEQFLMPETAISPVGDSASLLQAQTLARLSSAPDQLRQRVAAALAQVLVISLNKNVYAPEVLPYLQLLSRHAFGNYRTLLGELSISSPMGKYLDLANSNKPLSGSGANENYARELLQLFSIGLVKLNLDGSPQLDAAGRPLPAYSQAEVQQLARALTGWTYPGPGNNNWENFSGPMQPRDVNHDSSTKQFLGCSLPAGRGAREDMTAALDCVFAHPNLGPFLATRLIRALVSSNPSPAYIARVAAVFNRSPGGQRGDLRAVVRAILLDTEARTDIASPNGGRLKDPVQQVVGLLRAMGGQLPPGNQLAWYFSRLGENPLTPPSVFGHHSPLFRLADGRFAPEFQIYTPNEAVLRGNLFWQVLTQPGSDVVLDLAPLVALAGNTANLINRVDQLLLYGRMPSAMRQSIANAVAAQTEPRDRALTALYLTLLSGQQAVQH